jgi:hypothetical protein
MRDMTIYHEVQHIHGERRDQCAQNKLIMLLPTKKKRLIVEEEPAKLSET